MSKFYTCYVLYMFMYHFIFSPFRIGLESGLHNIVYNYLQSLYIHVQTELQQVIKCNDFRAKSVWLAQSDNVGCRHSKYFMLFTNTSRDLWHGQNHCPRGDNGIEITRDIEENVDLTVRLVFVTLGYCLLKIRTMIDFVFDKTRIQNINIYMYSYHLPMTIMGLVYHWE